MSFKEEQSKAMGEWLQKHIRVGQSLSDSEYEKVQRKLRRETAVKRAGRALRRQFEVS